MNDHASRGLQVTADLSRSSQHTHSGGASLLVERLGLVVEGRALLEGAEALDVQRLAGGVAGGDPWALLALGGALLGDDLVLPLLFLVRSPLARPL